VESGRAPEEDRSEEIEMMDAAINAKAFRFGMRDRYSAKGSTRTINFLFLAPQAEEVSVVGDFNDWNPRANPMDRQPDGGWIARIPMHHGHHRYLFMVDGERMLDPRAHGQARMENNEKVSLVAVS